MMKPLSGVKIAVLVANGFEEAHFLKAQKTLQEMGATMRLISSNQGLVNGWDGSGWGHNYAVDEPLNTALGVDYSALIIPGGQRSVEKLKLTAHTRRFIGSFMAADKPVAVMGDAIMLMAMTEQITGRKVTGSHDSHDTVEQSGGNWTETTICQDNNLLSGKCNAEDLDDYFSTMTTLFMQNEDMKEAA